MLPTVTNEKEHFVLMLIICLYRSLKRWPIFKSY